MTGWTTKAGSQLHSQPIKASALLDREAQQESLKKAFHMLSSMDPRGGGPCQRIEDSSYRFRAEPQSTKPQALFVPPHLS